MTVSSFAKVSSLASTQHGGVAASQLDRLGVSTSLRSKWVARGLLQRAGPRAFVVAGSEPTWRREAWTAAVNVHGLGFVAGRTAARIHGLDGFGDGPPEVLVGRTHRGCRLPYVVRSTSLPLEREHSVVVDGIRCLTAERTILESALFGFTAAETENAIDSGVRRRKVNEQRLRAAVLDRSRPGIAGSRLLTEALVDAGGESRLERWFLRLLRDAGVPRPVMRVVVRSAASFACRLDASFPGGLVVELEGHQTHSSRRQRQHDEARRTELVLMGRRVVVFTYLDVRDRPAWVASQVARALAMVA